MLGDAALMATHGEFAAGFRFGREILVNSRSMNTFISLTDYPRAFTAPMMLSAGFGFARRWATRRIWGGTHTE